MGQLKVQKIRRRIWVAVLTFDVLIAAGLFWALSITEASLSGVGLVCVVGSIRDIRANGFRAWRDTSPWFLGTAITTLLVAIVQIGRSVPALAAAFVIALSAVVLFGISVSKEPTEPTGPGDA